MSRHLPPAALAALLATGLAAQEAPPRPGPTPEEIAAGLLPAIQFEGEAPTAYALAERMAHYNVAGVGVALLSGGRVAWSGGWGVADRGTGTPVTGETLFQAASISKPVAALAALSLVDEGRVGLDQPVNEVLTTWKIPDNEFTADSAVTLRHLLTHSAGLTVWGFPGYRKDRPFAEGQAVATNAQVLDGEGNTPPVRVYKVPGTSWQYSGGGYTVMEQMVEDLTGLPFEEAARLRVLEPAGMTRSTYRQPLPAERWPEAARGHRGDGSEVEGEWHSYPEQAAAGLWTTPGELLTLSAHLLGILDGSVKGGVVSRPTLEAMLTPNHPGDTLFSNWGLGFGLQGEGEALRFGHGGSNEGFRAQWTVLRHRGEGIAVMTNGDAGSPLAAEILRGAAAAFGWPVPELRPRTRARLHLAPEALAEYEGAYEAEERPGFTVRVRVEGDALVAAIPGQGEMALHPAASPADAFFNRDTGQPFEFHRDADGRVAFVRSGTGPRFLRR